MIQPSAKLVNKPRPEDSKDPQPVGYAMHVDQTAANEADGYKPTYISYGKYKTEGNPDEPLTDEARAEIQARVDNYGRMFEEAVAKYRGVTVAKVRSDFGQGRMLSAKNAVAAGLADRVATFEETIDRLMTGKPRVKPRLAAAHRLLGV